MLLFSFADKMLDAIYDVSIAYPGEFPQNEAELTSGKSPSDVHFLIKRHPVASLPTTDEGLNEWCSERWAEKEKCLENFYRCKSFTDGDVPNSDGNLHSTEKNNNSGEPPATLYIAFVFWTIVVVIMTGLLIVSSLARWYAVILTTFHLFMCWRGGFELFQVDWFNRWYNTRKRD